MHSRSRPAAPLPEVPSEAAAAQRRGSERGAKRGQGGSARPGPGPPFTLPPAGERGGWATRAGLRLPAWGPVAGGVSRRAGPVAEPVTAAPPRHRGALRALLRNLSGGTGRCSRRTRPLRWESPLPRTWPQLARESSDTGGLLGL